MIIQLLIDVITIARLLLVVGGRGPAVIVMRLITVIMSVKYQWYRQQAGLARLAVTETLYYNINFANLNLWRWFLHSQSCRGNNHWHNFDITWHLELCMCSLLVGLCTTKMIKYTVHLMHSMYIIKYYKSYYWKIFIWKILHVYLIPGSVNV